MNRTPGAEVQRILRQEVAYGCPVESCRQPFLTWHHFDPPWRRQEHHNPDGMIALCRAHHDFADSGGYSILELRNLKLRGPYLPSVKANFPWAKKSILIRMGGCYAGGHSAILKVAGEPIISMTLGSDGMLMLSFVLRAPNGDVVAEMQENGFQASPSELHDLRCSASATQVQVWLKKGDIGLDLAFSRVTSSELYAMLKDGEEKADAKQPQSITKMLKVFEEAKERMLSQGPPWLKEWQEQKERDYVPWWLEELPRHLRTKHANDGAATVKTSIWAESNCIDDEGKLTLIDFRNMHIHANGREIRVRNGIAQGNLKLLHCSSFGATGMFDL